MDQDQVENLGAGRRREISLTSEQQAVLLPGLTQLASNQLRVPEHEVGNLVIETLSKLTPNSAMSEVVVLNAFQEELTAFQADALAYDHRSRATHYTVHNLDTAANSSPNPISSDLINAQTPGGHPPKDVMLVDDWFNYAHGIDGYHLAQLIGMELADHAQATDDVYNETGRWRGSLLDLRLVLYYKARAFRHWGTDIEKVG